MVDSHRFIRPRHWPGLATNRILFYSEHTGWMHIFSMNADGSNVKDITPGEGEVESFVSDPTGQFIYFDGNVNDIDRGNASGNPT